MIDEKLRLMLFRMFCYGVTYGLLLEPKDTPSGQFLKHFKEMESEAKPNDEKSTS